MSELLNYYFFQKYNFFLYNIIMKITRKENGINANTNAKKEAF